MKNLFQKIKNSLDKAFGSLLGVLINNSDAAIKATNIAKSIINNPLLSVAVAFTVNKNDDNLLAKAKILAPAIGVKLAMAIGIIKELDESESIDIAYGKVLKLVSENLPNEGKAIYLRELSGAIGDALINDGKISTGELIGIIQLRYKKLI